MITCTILEYLIKWNDIWGGWVRSKEQQRGELLLKSSDCRSGPHFKSNVLFGTAFNQDGNGSSKKTGYFTVRLTVSVYPPPYGQQSAFFEKKFRCVFYLRIWFCLFLNGFYTRKVIFIQLQEFPTPPYCQCCSVTKQSDSCIAEALKFFKNSFLRFLTMR